MKKHLLASVTFIALSIALFNGCKKDDTTAPVITLLGNNPDEMVMRTTYVEPGFTASDDEDGDITGRVAVVQDIDENLPGDYEIHYSVSDDAGNASDVHREVVVIATGAAMVDNYDVKDTCGTGASAIPYAYTQNLSLGSSSNRVVFSLFADYSGNTGIYADISSNGTITLPQQDGLDIGTQTEDHTFTGVNAYVTSNGFYLEYTDRNNSAIPVATAVCRAHFTRL